MGWNEMGSSHSTRTHASNASTFSQTVVDIWTKSKAFEELV
jgi:hypothetical protein